MKTKNISLTDKQFESLLRALAIAGSMYAVMGDMVDEKYKKQAALMDNAENMLCSYAYAFGMGKAVEEFEKELSIDMQSDWYQKVFDDIHEYDEYVTFEILSNKLAWRDFYATYSKEEIEKISKEHGRYMGVPLYKFENKYFEEFNEHEYERLYIDESKKDVKHRDNV